MSGPNNPRAFPLPHFEQNGRFFYQDGMTLRDWFAGQALDAAWTVAMEHSRSPEEPEMFAARQAYAIADAMLAERAKSGGNS